MAEDLTPNIINNATGPKSYTVDGETAVSNSIADQITADRYLAAKARNTGLPGRRVKMRPQSPSGVDRCNP